MRKHEISLTADQHWAAHSCIVELLNSSLSMTYFIS